MTLLYSHHLHEAEAAWNNHDHGMEPSHRVITTAHGHLSVAIEALCPSAGPWFWATKQMRVCLLYFPRFFAFGKHFATACTSMIFSRTWYAKSFPRPFNLCHGSKSRACQQWVNVCTKERNYPELGKLQATKLTWLIDSLLMQNAG